VIVPFGDQALLVVLGDEIDPGSNERAHALARTIAALAPAEESVWGVPVAGYASVLVPFDAALSAGEATARLTPIVEAAEATVGEGAPDSREPEPLPIAVRYGGEDGPDLAAVAERTGLTPAQVVDAHASTVYRVYLLGFVPGFAYLGVLPPELVLPRREEPRARVPRGSVGIAGRQTAVYPSETPGGWHLIGRSDATLWDMDRESPALLEPGQRVRFVPVGAR
jgi:KipI family sensor histidine kinase inhibitor